MNGFGFIFPFSFQFVNRYYSFFSKIESKYEKMNGAHCRKRRNKMYFSTSVRQLDMETVIFNSV